ncbi:MAG: DUF441 domain-containing protein, partial [Mycoplasmatales bacterium]
MVIQPYIFLTLLLVIGLIAKNNSLVIAVLFLLILKITPLSDIVFPYMKSKGINLGITVITIAVLVPIATGELGFKQLIDAMKSYTAWIAIGSGMLVSIFARDGVKLLESDPYLTVALVMGTIFSIAVFKGLAVGPLIG